MLVLLPGNSARNKEWIESIRDRIRGEIVIYEHWKSGEKTIDIDCEVKKLIKLANGEVIDVFAKSAGCIVALQAVHRAGLNIRKAVFVGTAVLWADEMTIPVMAWLEEWSVPTLFIQKQQDPAISAEELRGIMPSGNELIVLPGDDHDYLELDAYIGRVKEFLN